RSQSELARANPNEAPPWAKDYDSTEMHAMIGTVHYELTAFETRHADTAIPELHEALAGYDDLMARSRTFNLTMLATSHLRQGDVDHGIQIGRKALMGATTVRSTRVTDRLKPLEIELAQLPNNSDSRELCHLIRAHRSV
ncbi:MAG TPA: transcriptional regulator, partial [Pseudonocardiaceae bacterium]|nr:transcriptional regulator [Pseudonocardiaceae bacterium]